MHAPVSPDNISLSSLHHFISFPLFISPSESSHIFSFSLHLLISSYHLKLVIKPHPCTNRLPPIFYFMYLLSSSLSFSFSPLNFCFSPRRIISSPSSFLTHKNFSIFNMKKFSPKYYLKSTSIRSSLGNVNKHELHHICGPSYSYLLLNLAYNDELI